MPRYDVEEVQSLQDNFAKGLVSRVSPLGATRSRWGSFPLTYVKAVRNVIFRPSRAFAVRPGYRDISATVLLEPPVSLGKHYHESGNTLFVGTDAGGNTGHLWRYSATSRTPQSVPFVPSDNKWRFEMANALLVGTQVATGSPPCFYAVDNPANTWMSLVLPKPTTAVTFGSNAAGGSLAVSKDYFYRVRWRFKNGSSRSGPVSASHQAVAASGNYTFVLTVPTYTGSRTDYLGWTLERTKQNGSALGPFYWVADGGSTSASDGGSDASLFDERDEDIHGEPVPMDGVIYHRNRLFGWKGSLLYCSQPTTGEAATGICNWVGDLIYPVGKDDGDDIQQVILQGDRLLIGKRRSLWSLDGDDVDSFRLVPRYEGVGFCGPKSAAALGTTVFFAAGDGAFWVARGNDVKPVGADEVGDYLVAMDTTRDADIIALNHRGEYILFWYVPTGHADADEVLAYDLTNGTWTHWDSMPAVDAIVQKDKSDFGSATLLFADPRLLPGGNSGSVSTNPSFVVWVDAGNYNSTNAQVWVQKIAADGTAQWGTGIQVSLSVGAETFSPHMTARVIADGLGCIVLWSSSYSTTGYARLYAQKFDADGTPQWTPTAPEAGVLLENNGYHAWAGKIIAATSDGEGGVIYAANAEWSATPFRSTITAQRIDSFGNKLWGASGTDITGTLGTYDGFGYPGQISLNADGSCIISFRQAYRASFVSESFRVHKLDALGVEQFATADGYRINSSGGYGFGNSNFLCACNDDAGGAFVVSHSSGTVYLTRLNGSGVPQLGTPGIAVNSVSTSGGVVVLRDAAGGCIVAWYERVGASVNCNVYARRYTASGLPLWGQVLLGTALLPTSSHLMPMCGVEDGFGGALIGWTGNNAAGGGNGLTVNRVTAAGATPWGSAVQVADSAVAYDDTGWTPDLTYPPRLITDGASGAIAYWSDDRTHRGSSAIYRELYAQRIRSDGTLRDPVGGKPVPMASTAGGQDFAGSNFVGAPESEYPSAATPGYHVWAGLIGTTDMADVNGENGIDIPIQLVSHFNDDGRPEDDKDYDWIEVYVNRGRGTIVVTVDADDATATITLSTDATAPKYDIGLLYDTGLLYGVDGRTKVGGGIVKGTVGRANRVTITGALQDMEIGGWKLTGYALPRKGYS